MAWLAHHHRQNVLFCFALETSQPQLPAFTSPFIFLSRSWLWSLIRDPCFLKSTTQFKNGINRLLIRLKDATPYDLHPRGSRPPNRPRIILHLRTSGNFTTIRFCIPASIPTRRWQQQQLSVPNSTLCISQDACGRFRRGITHSRNLCKVAIS